MDYRRVGRSGLVVSTVTLGSSTATGNAAYSSGRTGSAGNAEGPFLDCVRLALEAGVNTFDTAAAYSRGRAEELLGRALAAERREDLVLCTKVYFPDRPGVNNTGLSRKHIVESLDGSLRRLGVDHVDIYLAHRFDHETPLEETMRAFADLVRSGKALYIGVSEWTSPQLRAAAGWATELGVPLIADQVVHSPVYRVSEELVLPTCAELGLGAFACAPLASGLLTGKYRPDQPPPAGSRGADGGNKSLTPSLADTELLTRIQRLRVLAAEAGLSLPRLIVAWVLTDPRTTFCSAVVGATHPGHLTELLAAADTSVGDDLRAEIDAVLGDRVVRDPTRTLSPPRRPRLTTADRS